MQSAGGHRRGVIWRTYGVPRGQSRAKDEQGGWLALTACRMGKCFEVLSQGRARDAPLPGHPRDAMPIPFGGR